MDILQVNIDRIGIDKLAPTDDDYRETGTELFKAFETVGFVYIKGHGISKDVIDKSMERSREFFNLPIEKKKQILRDPDVQQGYVEAGMELFNSKEVNIFKALFRNSFNFSENFT